MSDEYDKARKAALKEMKRARAAGENPFVEVLDDILPNIDVLTQIHMGIQEIPMRSIAGTKTAGRASAFAKNFLPVMEKGTEFSSKWNVVYNLQVEKGISDPITVYEYLAKFYVVEGNKRVSVMKYLGVPSIDADVIRIMPAEKNDWYASFLQFYQCCPIYDLIIHRPHGYLRFASLVHKDLKKPWDKDFINIVRGAFFRFYQVFEKKGGAGMDISAGDAFLLYLQIYRFDSLLDKSRTDIEKRLVQMWKEIAYARQSDDIDLLKEPLPAERKGFFNASVLYDAERPLKVLFVYEDNPQEVMWENDHDNGRIYLNAKYSGIVKADALIVPDQKADPIRIKEDVSAYDVVFSTRRELMTDTLRAALKYPHTRFFNCSLNLPHASVTGYYVKMYEAMFLMGICAGHAASDHKIGYLANAPVYGRLSEINAFAIGAQMADPQAKICLAWSAEKDSDWEAYFKENNIKIYCGPDQVNREFTQPVYPLHLIENGEAHTLMTPVWNWNHYYENIINMILNGSWDQEKIRHKGALNIWWGMDSGVIDVNVSSRVPWSIRKEIGIWKKIITNDAWNPFEGELRGQFGIIQKAGEERLPSHRIIAMDWLNENIIGTIPTLDDLKEESLKLVYTSGIKGQSE